MEFEPLLHLLCAERINVGEIRGQRALVRDDGIAQRATEIALLVERQRPVRVGLGSERAMRWQYGSCGKIKKGKALHTSLRMWFRRSVPKWALASLGNSAGRLSTEPSMTPGASQLPVSTRTPTHALEDLGRVHGVVHQERVIDLRAPSHKLNGAIGVGRDVGNGEEAGLVAVEVSHLVDGDEPREAGIPVHAVDKTADVWCHLLVKDRTVSGMSTGTDKDVLFGVGIVVLLAELLARSFVLGAFGSLGTGRKSDAYSARGRSSRHRARCGPPA